MGSNVSSSPDNIVKTEFPIESNMSDIIVQVEPFCKQHNKRLTLFCKHHDCPCCITCNSQNHKQCKNHIAKIGDVVQNIKTSHAFQENEQLLAELSDNIKKIQEDREQNLVSLKDSKIQVEKEIKEFRVKINDYLDRLEDDVIQELNKLEKTESSKIQKMVDDLKQREKDIVEMQVNFSNIKQHASNIQAFLAMKQIQQDVNQSETAIESLVSSDNLQQKKFSLEINTSVKDILKTVKNLGKILVEAEDSNVVITKMKNQQAQSLVQHRPYRGIDDIKLQLHQTLLVNSIHARIIGCCSLPDGRLVFSYPRNLIIINADGTQNTTLTLPSGGCDVIYVPYNNTLAVTSAISGSNQRITLINITSKKVQETIELHSLCFGMAVKDHILFYCTKDSIKSVNLKNKSITKFKDFKRAHVTYIDIYANNLYHTNYITNTITCYDLNGEVKWEFKDENIIKQPTGISVDKRGYVYVAGTVTSNVVVISPDGQKCRELLSTSKDPDERWTIYYDRSTDKLFVTNSGDQNAFLYKVT